MKCRFLGIILLFVLINTFALAQMPTSNTTITEECKSLYWFDGNTRECGYKQFCGAYMYQGLQTFETKEECENALNQTINPEPNPSPAPEKCCPPKCMFAGTRSEGWYDSCNGERISWAKCANCTAVCEHKGTRSEGWYAYCKGENAGSSGLIKYANCSDCEESGVAETPTQIEITQPNIVVSSTGSIGGGAGVVYSVGTCPSEQPEVCTQEYAPVCATIQHFNLDGTYTKYRKTFGNACMACASSTRTDYVVEYTSGKCKEETSSKCPLIARPSPESCPDGKLQPVYKELNGEKCIIRYECTKKATEEPVENMPVFIYSEKNTFAGREKVFKLYKNGAMVETIAQHIGSETGVETMKRLKGEISQERVLEFLKKLEEKGFFEIELGEVTCCVETEEGVTACVEDSTIFSMYARYKKENKLKWCLLDETPEAIEYALNQVKEFESILEENPAQKYVKLGEAFDLYLREKAKVRETGLEIKLERVYSEGAVFSVSAPYGVAHENVASGYKATEAAIENPYRWIEIKTGESRIVFGHKITLNSTLFPKCVSEETEGRTVTKCIGARPFANLTITKPVLDEETITAYLDKKFTMKQGQHARVLDESGKMVMGMSLESILIPVDCGARECKVDPETGVEICEKIWCDTRPTAKLLVRIPSSPTTDITLMRPVPVAIREGESKIVGSFKIYFADLIGGEKAVFVVNRLGEEIPYKKVELGEEFELKVKETALIVEKDIFVTLLRVYNGPFVVKPTEPQPLGETPAESTPSEGYAIVSVWKKGWGVAQVPVTDRAIERIEGIKENVKEVLKETKAIEPTKYVPPIMPYKKMYTLKPGQTLKVYDIKLTLNSLGKNSAKFVANEIVFSDIINVQIGEPFKLKENMSARVLGANMRIDLLNIIGESYCQMSEPPKCFDKKLVKIGVSHLLFDVKKIGKAISTSVISQQAGKELVERAVGEEESIEPIEMPPTPFKVFTLGEGESASVGDFEIRVEAIWPEHAEFIVKEKGTGIKFKLVISKGWNLFSLPGEMRSIGSNDCHSSDFRLFEYLPEENRFERVKKPEAGRAYWLYNPGNACKVEAELVKPVSLFEVNALNKGWNFVPVLKDMFDKKIGEMGNCKLKGAFFYDAENHQWKKALEETLGAEHLGRALAVFAVEKCSLVSPETPIPELPELPELPEVE